MIEEFDAGWKGIECRILRYTNFVYTKVPRKATIKVHDRLSPRKSTVEIAGEAGSTPAERQ